MPLGTTTLAPGGSTVGDPVNNCIPYQTQTAGTRIRAVIPPRDGVRAKAWAFGHRQAATQHTLTFMTGWKQISVVADAAAGQAIVLFSEIPSDPTGAAMAAGDVFVLRHSDMSWDDYQVSSISSNAVTMTANLSQQVLAGSKAFYMGAPGDYAGISQFIFAASTTREIGGGDERRLVAVAAADGWPIVFDSDNSTNAGFLEYIQYGYTFGA